MHMLDIDIFEPRSPAANLNAGKAVRFKLAMEFNITMVQKGSSGFYESNPNESEVI